MKGFSAVGRGSGVGRTRSKGGCVCVSRDDGDGWRGDVCIGGLRAPASASIVNASSALTMSEMSGQAGRRAGPDSTELERTRAGCSMEMSGQVDRRAGPDSTELQRTRAGCMIVKDGFSPSCTRPKRPPGPDLFFSALYLARSMRARGSVITGKPGEIRAGGQF